MVFQVKIDQNFGFKVKISAVFFVFFFLTMLLN